MVPMFGREEGLPVAEAGRRALVVTLRLARAPGGRRCLLSSSWARHSIEPDPRLTRVAVFREPDRLRSGLGGLGPDDGLTGSTHHAARCWRA